MNRKGFLLAEETLKIVIAVISISFLVYFLASLYVSNQNSKDLGLAKASLDYLGNEINEGSPVVEIYNPEDWIIISWPYNNMMPQSCKNLGWKKCICICKESWRQTPKFYEKRCDDIGVCQESEMVVDGSLTTQFILIDKSPIKLNIDPVNKIIK